MEAFIVFAVLLIVIAPIILSIVAIAKVSSLRQELHQLRLEFYRSGRADVVKATPPPVVASVPEPIKESPVAEPVKKAKPSSEPVASVPVPPPIPIHRTVAPPVKKKPEFTMEFLMGGRAAAFAGIAILVTGIAFLVGYAIQHAWLGPVARVVLGLIAGLVLVGTGHFVSLKDEKFTLFARVLTGGGSALFYFVVFAAFAFYHLIGAVVAGVGLFISATAVFALAMLYCSQAVAVLGVLGAFITPILIGGEMDAGTFALVYVALINVPVILLGVRRQWQLLYNLSFVFTVIHFVIWMDRIREAEFTAGLVFALIFFFQYVALGLLKLRREQQVLGRNLDLVRLVLSSLLLLGAVFRLLDDAGANSWIGGAFALIALLHFGLARFAFKILTHFAGEITAFIAGGMLFLTMALPAQFDGAWVTLGWGVEGAVLAWFAMRVKSRILQSGAFMLGLIGLMKGLMFDVGAYDQDPGLFLNARFAVGLISAVLLGVQGKVAGRFKDENGSDPWQDVIWWIGIFAAVLFCFSDIFGALGSEDHLAWLLSSLVLLATGAASLLFAPPRSTVVKLGCLLLIAVPVKVVLVDTLLVSEFVSTDAAPFAHAVIWVQLVMMGVIALAVQPRLAARTDDLLLPVDAMEKLMNLSALAAALGVVTLEILRAETDWADVGVTILWAVSALVLILYGMKKQGAAHRYFGLILFGLATLKVLIVDSSELEGLERIGAFMGTGVLLLVLSLAYQKASAYFQMQSRQNEKQQ